MTAEPHFGKWSGGRGHHVHPDLGDAVVAHGRFFGVLAGDSAQDVPAIRSRVRLLLE